MPAESDSLLRGCGKHLKLLCLAQETVFVPIKLLENPSEETAARLCHFHNLHRAEIGAGFLYCCAMT